MKKTIRTVITLLAIVAVIVLVAAKLIDNKKAVAAKVLKKDPDTRVAVNIDTVAFRPLNEVNEYLGSFEANKQVTMSAETQGRVIAATVKEGDRIRAGQLIAHIDDDGLQAQRFSAQATYSNAQQNLERYKNASVGEGVSQMQVDQQALTMKSAEAQLRQIDKQIQQSTILAPFDGTVTGKGFELGTYVSPGSHLLDIADISTVKLDLNIPENDLFFFTKGKKVTVYSSVYPGISFTGTVDELVSKADATHNFPVKVTILNHGPQRLLPGMYGKLVKDDSLAASSLVIPRSSLLGSAKEPQVFVIKDGEARLTNILTGRSNDKWIEVTKGLSAGDLVVSSGQVNLGNGTKVTAIH